MQTKAIFQLQKWLKYYANKVYTYLLTGTPFTTGYIDLYTQLKALGYQETKTYFTDRFCTRGNVPGLLGWQQPIVGYKNITELFRTVHNYAITVKSEDVIKLPEQVFVNHSIEQSKEVSLFTYDTMKGLTILEELKNRNVEDKEILDKYRIEKKVNNPFYRNIAYPDMKWLAETKGTFWLRTRQLSIGFQGNTEEAEWYDRRRLDAIKEFLEEHPDNYIIFYNFTPELFELVNICDDLGYSIDVFCGLVKSMSVYEEYCNMTEEQKFNAKKRVIIANFASGSTGMNWQQYNKVIIASTPVYKDYAQAIKRVHRPGQKYTTFYHSFFQDNWLDKGMQEALTNQIEYTDDMFEDDLARVKRLLENSSQNKPLNEKMCEDKIEI